MLPPMYQIMMAGPAFPSPPPSPPSGRGRQLHPSAVPLTRAPLHLPTSGGQYPDHQAYPYYLPPQHPPNLTPTPPLLTSQICEDMEAILDHMRRDSTSDARHQHHSMCLVEGVFNNHSLDASARSRLWSDLCDYEDLCHGLGVPAFPISPTKVALFLARYVDLPATDYLRWLAPPGLRKEEYSSMRLLSMLATAAHATALYWTPCASFTSFAASYPVIEEVLKAKERKEIRNGSKPRSDPFHPFPVFVNSIIPILNDLQTEEPDLDLQPRAHQRIMRSLSTSLHSPSIFEDYQSYIAFSTTTGFLPHPINCRKLALFALSMTGGPAGETFRSIERHNRRRTDSTQAAKVSPQRLAEMLWNMELAARAAVPGWREEDGEYGADARQWNHWREAIIRDAGHETRTLPTNCRPRARDPTPASVPSEAPKSTLIRRQSASPPPRHFIPSQYSSSMLRAVSNERDRPTSTHPTVSSSGPSVPHRPIPSYRPYNIADRPSKTPHYHILALPTPPPVTASERKVLRENLPADRRCPPLPVVIPAQEAAPTDMERTIAAARPRRGPIVEMRELDWGNLRRAARKPKGALRRRSSM